MDRPIQDRNSAIYLATALCLVIFLAFYPVLGSSFVNYDDPSYVTDNLHVKAGLTLDGIRWAFTSIESYNWHPLTWISHMLDVQLFGLNPAGHHLVSLLLHLANSILLFVVLRDMTGATVRSCCVAALFALHPLHVQSVAWIAERKDVLSTLFWLLAILAYSDYAKRLKSGSYLLCIGLFAMGLMAKPMVITLPVVLLLMDWWPLKRLSSSVGGGSGRTWLRCLMEKVPFLALSALSGAVTYLAQEKGGAVSDSVSVLMNAAHAATSYMNYLVKTVWPVRLAAFYPYYPDAQPQWQLTVSLLIIAAATVSAILAARRYPYCTTGWFWYLVTLLPVSGLIRIGQHDIADRYTYIPLIGIFVIVVWGGAELAERLKLAKAPLAYAAAAVLVLLAVATHRQVRTWHDSVTLFQHAIDVTENNWLAHKNLATALVARGNLSEALRHVDESLRIKPDVSQYVSQGWLNLELGQHAKAVEACKRALTMEPGNEKAHFILGVAHLSLRDYSLAQAEYEALRRVNSPLAPRLRQSLTDAARPLQSGSHFP